MRTYEIIKRAFYLPFKAYKGFILVTILFFMSEIVNAITNHMQIGDLTIFVMLAPLAFGIIVLGFCIAIVYHYIDDSFDLREVSIITTTKAGFKDTAIEIYYYTISILSTIIISYALGLYRNIFTLYEEIEFANHEMKNFTLIKLFEYLSPQTYHQLAFSVMAALTIFIILFAICFSYCSLAKIRLKETGNMKESMNFIKLTQIIKQKGLKKYLNFVILTFIVFATVLILMKTLESYFFIGSLISALSEAFALFFILDSFSLFYHY